MCLSVKMKTKWKINFWKCCETLLNSRMFWWMGYWCKQPQFLNQWLSTGWSRILRHVQQTTVVFQLQFFKRTNRQYININNLSWTMVSFRKKPNAMDCSDKWKKNIILIERIQPERFKIVRINLKKRKISLNGRISKQMLKKTIVFLRNKRRFGTNFSNTIFFFRMNEIDFLTIGKNERNGSFTIDERTKWKNRARPISTKSKSKGSFIVQKT